MKRVLACIGDVRDMNTHSGHNYHLWRIGLASGFLQDGWSLHPERLRRERLWWNAKELTRTGRYGGFQYTRDFLDALFSQAPAKGVTEIVSTFQLFPDHSVTEANLSFYIDATLTQLFNDYGVGSAVSPRVVEDALQRERQQYEHAHQIVCWSNWAARSVVEQYGVQRHKVHVVHPGANVDAEGLEPHADEPVPIGRLVRLGFMGKDWRRKNLPFLLEVADELRRRSRGVEVVAAGFEPETGPRHGSLTAQGFLDKKLGMANFVRFMRSCHFTCLFSTAEAFGLSNLESLSLGVPVLGWDVGGIAETVPDGLGIVFSKDASPREVATAVERYIDEPEAYAALRQRVMARSREYTWSAALDAFGKIWSGSTAHQYRGA